MVSTSRIITPSTQSQVTIRDNSVKLPYNAAYMSNQSSQINKTSEYNHIYSRENYNMTLSYEDYAAERMQNSMHLNAVNQHKMHGEFNEFDNFSQVISEEENFSMRYGMEAAQRHNELMLKNISINKSNTELNASIYPYSVRGNSEMNAVFSRDDLTQNTITQASDLSQKSAYRAVEYSKSSEGERVRVTNTEEINGAEEYASQAYRIDSSEFKTTTEIRGESKKSTLTEDSEKSFVVKFFPTEQEKETQEMTMFVDASNDDLNLKTFKINLNQNKMEMVS